MLNNKSISYAPEVVMFFWLLLCILGLLDGCSLPAKPLIQTSPTQALADAVAKTNWVIALSIVGIALSVMAWINGSKTAIGVSVGCAVALWLQITVVRYANVLAWVGLVFAVGIMLWTVFVKNRALKEIVTGVQTYKNSANIPLSTFLGEQKEATQKIVSQIKGKLPGKKV